MIHTSVYIFMYPKVSTHNITLLYAQIINTPLCTQLYDDLSLFVYKIIFIISVHSFMYLIR